MDKDKYLGWLKFGGSALSSVANVISTALTNKSNQRIAAAQNAMQIAENEKAYQRSKATNQVNLLQAAGMSKAGALNALNGGGSYQPAPITSTPNQAPEIDLSSAFDGLIQIGENAKQRKMQEEALDKQITAAKEQQKAQFEENAKQRDHDLEMQSREHNNTNRNADNRLNFEKSVHDFFKDKQNQLLEQQIESYIESNKASKQQREHFETIKPFLKNRAEEEVNLIKQQIQRAKDQTDIEYKEYLLNKIRTTINAKFGVRIDELRNSIDFWRTDRGSLSYTIGYAGTNKKLRELESIEKDFIDYLDEIDKILDELDNLDKK